MPVMNSLLAAEEAGGVLRLAARGRWTVTSAAELDRALRAIEARAPRRVAFDLDRLEALDTSGAWLLLRTRDRLGANGAEVRIERLAPDYAPLLRQVEEGGAPMPPSRLPPENPIAEFGESIERMGRKALSLLGFFGLVSEALWRTLRHPSRLRWTSFISHMEQTGVDALPIVGLLSFLIGVVFAYQGADQLRRFGAEIYTVNLLGISMLRELGVLITAILVAGRSGSAFTAQIGTMKVNEEIDAMRTLGLDPIEVLVLPRLFAVAITLPLLTFYANVMGLLGGAIMSYFALEIGFPTFLRQLKFFMPGWTFWVGMVKAPFFAGIIAVCGCYEGLRAARSAESVGRLTTTSVVEAIFLVIVVDAVFSIVFSILRI
jgi:phospholipid/cholesterol/gamma-HCH transport system permease protein